MYRKALSKEPHVKGMGRVEGTSFLAPNQDVENAGRFLSVGRGWSIGTDLYDHRKLSCQFFKNLF